MNIKRIQYTDQIHLALKRSPVVAILGPRQCGKTTLARAIAKSYTEESDYYDLESPQDVQRLQNPEMVLGSAKGLIVLDEVQALPGLFALLRSVVDRETCKARFLVLGSASPILVKGASESLAGRIEFVDLAPFGVNDVGYSELEKLWLRGGFPRSYLADTDADSNAWREGFVRTFLERDLPQLGITIPAPAMRRFWSMLAHYHGQTWNASAIAQSLSVSDKTVRSYLDILTHTYMMRQVQPWFENFGKRQVKAPKVFFRDSGLLHRLLELPDKKAVMGHPKVGASWEGFALEQVLRLAKPSESYFWGVHNGGEIDLVFEKNGRRYGVECKYSEAPDIPVALRHNADLLKLDRLWIVCPCRKPWQVTEKISVVNIESMAKETAITDY